MGKKRSLAFAAGALGALGLAAGVAHAVVVKGRGDLLARGHGVAVLELRGVATASGVGLAIVEEDALVEAGGGGKTTPLGDGRLLLEGFGMLELRSLDAPMRVELAGARLRLRARGAGVAVLRGNGFYATDDAEGRWGSDLRVELEEGEALP